VAELVDARDLKSLGSQEPCRFKSGRPHQASLAARASGGTPPEARAASIGWQASLIKERNIMSDNNVKDSNGTTLHEGDTVQVIKDLKVKGAGETIKRGTTIKNIHLTDNEEEIECRTGSIKGLVLKTCFLKKV
jgi:protein PhnA